MSNYNWEKLGGNIADLVEEAISSKEFKKLSQTITTTMSVAADEVERSIKKAQANKIHQEEIKSRIIHKDNTKLFVKTGKYKAISIVFMIIGYALAFSCSLVFLPALFTLLFLGGHPAALSLSIMFGTLSLISSFVGIKGTLLLQQIKRFTLYIQSMKGKDFINIEDLAKSTNKKEKYVLKDVKKMITKGWFIEGHLDHNNKTLMVTHETYNDYLRLVEQQQEAQKQKELYEKTTPSEIKKVLDMGEEYIREIRRCNDEIPGLEISLKIDKIELIVTKIFKRLQQHPENLNDLRKFMKYYLPTTIKLLRAYEELDKQPIQGENIINSKEDIEKTLDTLNIAFEKLFDDLFLETAWDVSSDITVLETLLAQEGLTKGGL